MDNMDNYNKLNDMYESIIDTIPMHDMLAGFGDETYQLAMYGNITVSHVNRALQVYAQHNGVNVPPLEGLRVIRLLNCLYNMPAYNK